MQKYPKLTFVIASYVIVFLLFFLGAFDWLHALKGWGYLSVVVGGLLYSFGITTPFALAIFVEIAPDVQPLVAAILAGMGSLAIDLILFRFFRKPHFADELERIRVSTAVRALRTLVAHERWPERVRRYAAWAFAALVIASPVPDEIGISVLSGLTRMKEEEFALLSFLLNTLGILVILTIA